MLRKCQRAENTGAGAQLRRLYEALEPLQHLRMVYVSVQQLRKFPTDQIEQLWLLHNSASEKKTARRQAEREVRQAIRQILCFQTPTCVIGRQKRGGHSPPHLHRRSTGKALQTVTVKRTTTRKRVARQIMRNSQMTHLRVNEAVHELSMDERPSADSRSDS